MRALLIAINTEKMPETVAVNHAMQKMSVKLEYVSIHGSSPFTLSGNDEVVSPLGHEMVTPTFKSQQDAGHKPVNYIFGNQETKTQNPSPTMFDEMHPRTRTKNGFQNDLDAARKLKNPIQRTRI